MTNESFYILNADEITPLVTFDGKEKENTNGSWVATKDLKSGMQLFKWTLCYNKIIRS